MTRLAKLREEMLASPGVAAEYERLGPEFRRAARARSKLTPRYVWSAFVHLVGVMMAGGGCGALVAIVVAVQYELFGTATMPGEVARVIVGTGMTAGVIMFVALKMQEIDKWLDLAADNGRIIGELRERLERSRG